MNDNFSEALIKLYTTSTLARAGNSTGIYSLEVPSSLTAAVAIKISPFSAVPSTEPEVPILINTSAPI